MDLIEKGIFSVQDFKRVKGIEEEEEEMEDEEEKEKPKQENQTEKENNEQKTKRNEKRWMIFKTIGKTS